MKKISMVLLMIFSFNVFAHDDGLTCHEHPHTHEPDHPPSDEYILEGWDHCPTCSLIDVDDLVLEEGPVYQSACAARGDNELGPRRGGE